MSQQFYVIVGRKEDKKEIATLDYVCGCGDYQDILSNNIVFDDNFEHIVEQQDEQLLKAIRELEYKQETLLENFKANLNNIQTNTLLLSNAKTKDIGIEYQETIDETKSSLIENIEEDYSLIYHLTLMLDRAMSATFTVDKNYEIVICWSN